MGNQSKYAVISDVHANAEALRSVLRDIRKRRIENIFFLGDAVGYGPEPNESVELLQSECTVMIAGNHDWGVVGFTETKSFNEYARIALTWTRAVLREDNLKILRGVPLTVEMRQLDLTVVHASPHEPELWHYLLTLQDAEINFRYMQTGKCFVGHSHKPCIIEMEVSGDVHMNKRQMHKREGSRYIINAGSIGQPRDGDPRACYAIVDDEMIELVKVGYDIRVTQKRMADAGLPGVLIERLSYGF